MKISLFFLRRFKFLRHNLHRFNNIFLDLFFKRYNSLTMLYNLNNSELVKDFKDPSIEICISSTYNASLLYCEKLGEEYFFLLLTVSFTISTSKYK